LARSNRHFFWIDALRGYAAVAVAIYHAINVLWIGYEASRAHGAPMLDKIAALVSFPFHYGYSGVILFFVISGFCIHWPYANAKSFELREYSVRRFWRIVPPYLAAVLFASVALPFMLPRMHVEPQTFAASFLMVQNYDALNGWFPQFWNMQIKSDPALWSLPIEVEFYIVYPILLLAARRFPKIGIFGVVALLSFATAALSLVYPHVLLFPDFMPWWAVWLTGAAIAELLAKDALPRWNWGMTLSGLAALGLGLVARRDAVHLPGIIEDYVWTYIFALLLIRVLSLRDWAPKPDGIFFRLSSFLGKISYSVYLTHYIVLYGILSLVTARTGHPLGNYFAVFALTLLTIPVGYLFWKLYENPSLGLAKRFSQRRAPSLPNEPTST
jgi:peptidoglycan/LPS O-acetylase OafA/YrhL